MNVKLLRKVRKRIEIKYVDGRVYLINHKLQKVKSCFDVQDAVDYIACVFLGSASYLGRIEDRQKRRSKLEYFKIKAK